MLHDPKTVIGSDFDQETAEKIAPQFIPRPAAAVPPAQQTPPSPNFVSGLSGSSFSLSIGGQ